MNESDLNASQGSKVLFGTETGDQVMIKEMHPIRLA